MGAKWLFEALLVLLFIVGVLSVIPAWMYWEEIWSWAHGNGASKSETLHNLALAYGTFLAAFIVLPLAIVPKLLFATLLVLLPIVGALSIIPVSVYWEEIWSWAHGNGASKGETLRNLALAYGAFLAACIGLPLAIWRSFVANRQAKAANSQAETSERGLRNERYQKGAEMLGSDTLATRLGGIAALARLAREHPEEHHVEIMDLLCAFVRHPTKTKAESEAVSAGAPKKKCPPYVEAAAKAVGKCRRDLPDEGALKRIEGDLIFDLAGANLEGANLFRVHLAGANLIDANLASANLIDATLEGANLISANLISAKLEGAELEGANLVRAELEGATLEDAHLEDADLGRAILVGAILTGAILTGANLAGATLEGATLAHAHLARANLHDAKLAGATLEGADLINAIGLTQEMLDSVRLSLPPKSLPEGLSWPFE